MDFSLMLWILLLRALERHSGRPLMKLFKPINAKYLPINLALDHQKHFGQPISSSITKKLKKIVLLLVSATSKLALATGKAEEDLSDAEMEMGEDGGAEEEEPDATGYVDVDLLDMDDLGLDAIDMPESKWIPAEELSLGSLASFTGDSTRQASQPSEMSSTSRSLFEGTQTATSSSSSSSIFSSATASSS